MPIGKDSIQKRIAKTEEQTETAAPKAPARKRNTTPKAAKPAETAPAVQAPAADAAPVSATGVMANVAPETVEKVIGHEEGKGEKHVQLFDKMPNYLL